MLVIPTVTFHAFSFVTKHVALQEARERLLHDATGLRAMYQF